MSIVSIVQQGWPPLTQPSVCSLSRSPPRRHRSESNSPSRLKEAKDKAVKPIEISGNLLILMPQCVLILVFVKNFTLIYIKGI